WLHDQPPVPRCRHSRNGRYGIFRRGSRGSLGLDVGRPDHLAPLLGVVGDELSEIDGRADKRRASKVGKPRLHLGIGEAGVDLLVELVDDLRRRVLGYADAISGQVPDITDRRPHHCFLQLGARQMSLTWQWRATARAPPTITGRPFFSTTATNAT